MKGASIQWMKHVMGLQPVVPSSTTPDYVSMKGYNRLRIIVQVTNATTVTGSAITLKQATAVAGTAEKALAFTKNWQNIDTAAAGGDVLTETTVSNNTFTTDATNSKNLVYHMEVKAEDLDVDNSFDCVRVGTGNATAATVRVDYLLYEPRYAHDALPTAVTD